MKFINREIPIEEIAAALDLVRGAGGNLHCWHPERHQHGDRTPSVGIRKANNTVKCFGCDSSPMSPLDLVKDVLGLPKIADAALWIADRFSVPSIPKKRVIVEEKRRVWPIGLAGPLTVLIRSGLWGRLSEPTRAIAAVLIELGEKDSKHASLLVKISYRGISRYSGVESPNAVSKALHELEELGWLVRVPQPRPVSVQQPVGQYRITPESDELREAANFCFVQHRAEICAERELRNRQYQEQRKARSDSKRQNGTEPSSFTK